MAILNLHPAHMHRGFKVAHGEAGLMLSGVRLLMCIEMHAIEPHDTPILRK